MDFEIFHVQEDGTRVSVEPSKLNDLLISSNVLILVDHIRRRIYNFNGKDAKIRTRFIGARIAANQLRAEFGMSYNIQAVEEGEENQKFRDLISEITCPGSSSSRAATVQRPPPTPPVVKIYIDKDVAQPDKLRPPERSILGPSVEETLPDLVKETKKVGSQRGETSTQGMGRETSIDVTSVINQLGGVPAGYDVEAVIVNSAVYKYDLVRSKVLGKETEQTKVEKMDTIEGIFTLDGEVRVLAKDGKVLGIQVLSKQKTPVVKKS